MKKSLILVLAVVFLCVAGGAGVWWWRRAHAKPWLVEPMLMDQGIKASDGGNFDEAIGLFTKAMGATDDPNHLAVIYNDRGVAYQRKGSHVRAIADFTEAVKLDKGYAKAYINRGRSHAALHEWKDAIADYSTARNWNAEKDARFYLGLAYLDVEEYDKAIAEFNVVCGYRPQTDAKPFVNRGIAWERKKEYAKAIADYNEAIRINPASASAYNNRGVVYKEQHELEKALADFTESLRLEPKNALALTGRGGVYAMQGNTAMAMEDLSAAIRLDPQSTVAFMRRGRVRESVGDYAHALEDYRAALRIEPKYAPVLNNLAWLLATAPEPALRDGKAAVNHALLACRLSPANTAYLDTLAAAYAESGDFEKAIASVQKYIDTPGLDAAALQKAKARRTLYEQKTPFRQGQTAPVL